MSHGRTVESWKLLPAIALIAMLAVAPNARAEEAAVAAEAPVAEEGPNLGNISLLMGFDITTHYFFRGLPQENQGFIIQPYAEVGFALWESDGPINSVGLYVGIWNSFHDEQTFASGVGSEPDSWYEADLYAGISVGFLDNFTFKFQYTALTSPNDAFPTIQELGFGLAYDDSGLWGDSGFALNPSTLFVVEIDNQADLNTDEGVYWQIGIAPSFEIVASESFPVTLTIPVTAGFSLDDYYQDPSSTDDDFFGFVDIGLDVSVPLPFIPASFGSWTATAGVHYIFLGNNAADFGQPVITDGDDDFIYGKFGLKLEY